MIIKTIPYQSSEYTTMCELRNEVLRRPINLLLTDEDIKKELNDIFIAAFDNQEIIGCCILTAINKQEIKLRQMAVKKGHQRKGIGKAILQYAEQTALANGYSIIILHARKDAVEFYQRNGYFVEGDEFTEVGIPHYEMIKQI